MATIERLAALEASGKQVTLKFYEDPPFWNLIITGELCMGAVLSRRS